MVFEKLIRYTGLAVGLKPSAMECEARLRGLYRIIYSKTIPAKSVLTRRTYSLVSWERGHLARVDATRAGRSRSQARVLPQE